MVTTIEKPSFIATDDPVPSFPPGGGRRAGFYKITPEMASVFLRSNFANRHISNAKLALYTADMAAGRWAVNGEPIIFSKDGLLNNGQHRLKACIASGKPFETLVCWGVDRETRTTLDQGKSRTLGDYLAMNEIANAKLLASAAKRIVAFNKSGGASVEAKYVSNAEGMEFMDRNFNSLVTSGSFGASTPKNFRIIATPSYVAFWHYILKRHDGGAEFLSSVISPSIIVEGDPAFTVRDRLPGISKSLLRKTEAVWRGFIANREGRKLSRLSLYGKLPPL